jgi:hypothetical protein
MGILPNNFDHTMFETAIERLVDTDHFQIVTRTLIFIYNLLDMFTGRERLKFTYELLLKKHFYELFLHWSDDVRACFYRILTYKINRISRLDLEEMEQQMNKVVAKDIPAKKPLKKPLKVKPHHSSPTPATTLSSSPPNGDFASMMRKRSGSRKTDDGPVGSTTPRGRTTVVKSHDDDELRQRRHVTNVPRRSLDSARPTLHQSTDNFNQEEEDEEEDDEGIDTTTRRRSLDEIHQHHDTDSVYSIGYNGNSYETEMERLRMEKAVDLILDSKIALRIDNLKYIAEHGKELEESTTVEPTTEAAIHMRTLETTLKLKEKDVPCPKHLYKFVGRAILQYAAIKQESDKWRVSVLNHLVNKRNQLMNSGTVSVIPVVYPNLVFPKFSLAAETEDSEGAQENN